MTRWSFCALLVLAACSDDGIGEACMPTIPCAADGTGCGFSPRESYTSETGCSAGQVCLVHHLVNDSATPRVDPRMVCTSPGVPQGCVSQEQIDRSIYCSCACARAGSDDAHGLCDCAEGFACTEVSPGLPSYCVKIQG